MSVKLCLFSIKLLVQLSSVVYKVCYIFEYVIPHAETWVGSIVRILFYGVKHFIGADF